MPKRSHTRTVLKKLPTKPARLVTKAHRQERDEDEAAIDRVRRTIASKQVAGKGAPARPPRS